MGQCVFLHDGHRGTLFELLIGGTTTYILYIDTLAKPQLQWGETPAITHPGLPVGRCVSSSDWA